MRPKRIYANILPNESASSINGIRAANEYLFEILVPSENWYFRRPSHLRWGASNSLIFTQVRREGGGEEVQNMVITMNFS